MSSFCNRPRAKEGAQKKPGGKEGHAAAQHLSFPQCARPAHARTLSPKRPAATNIPMALTHPALTAHCCMEDDDAARSLGDYESESDDDMPEPPPVDINRLMALYSAHHASFPVLPAVNTASGDASEPAAGQVDLAIPTLPYHRKTYTVHSFGTVEFERRPPVARIGSSIIDVAGPNYHNKRALFPIGFLFSRQFVSTVNTEQTCLYSCRILDGGDNPKVGSQKHEFSRRFISSRFSV